MSTAAKSQIPDEVAAKQAHLTKQDVDVMSEFDDEDPNVSDSAKVEKKQKTRKPRVAKPALKGKSRVPEVAFPHSVFDRYVRHVASSMPGMEGDMRFSSRSISRMHHASIKILRQVFADAEKAMKHGKRMTMYPVDFDLVSSLTEVFPGAKRTQYLYAPKAKTSKTRKPKAK